jgi:hypothetical protein
MANYYETVLQKSKTYGTLLIGQETKQGNHGGYNERFIQKSSNYYSIKQWFNW